MNQRTGFLWTAMLFNMAVVRAFSSFHLRRISNILPAHQSFGGPIGFSWQDSVYVRRQEGQPRVTHRCFLSKDDGGSTTAIKTLAPGSHQSEMDVKKSRFLGYASHVTSWEEAQAYIAEVKAEHPKARHWCYGFQCGVNPVTERCSDDGEPTGTAGVPILGAIKGEELSDVVCVVVRYFGGVKLGAGGLIRAYGASARQVLREAPVDVLIPKTTFGVQVDAGFVGAIYDCAAKAGGVTGGETYGTDGSLSVRITCDLEVSEGLKSNLSDATRGSANILED